VGTGLTGPSPQQAATALVDAYLLTVAAGLPPPARAAADLMAELGDGLWTAVEARHAAGADLISATRSAVAEFGAPEEVARDCARDLRTALARRTGVVLLGSGPVVGATWLVPLSVGPLSLLGGEAGGAWRAAPLLGAALAVAAPVTAALVVSTGRLARTIPVPQALLLRGTAVAGSAALVADTAMLAMLAISLVAGPSSWPWQYGWVAVTASTARLTFAGATVRRVVVDRLLRSGPPAAGSARSPVPRRVRRPAPGGTSTRHPAADPTAGAVGRCRRRTR
jgi:hypothetical protein